MTQRGHSAESASEAGGYSFSRTPNRKVLGFSYSKWRVLRELSIR